MPRSGPAVLYVHIICRTIRVFCIADRRLPTNGIRLQLFDAHPSHVQGCSLRKGISICRIKFLIFPKFAYLSVRVCKINQWLVIKLLWYTRNTDFFDTSDSIDYRVRSVCEFVWVIHNMNRVTVIYVYTIWYTLLYDRDCSRCVMWWNCAVINQIGL